AGRNSPGAAIAARIVRRGPDQKGNALRLGRQPAHSFGPEASVEHARGALEQGTAKQTAPAFVDARRDVVDAQAQQAGFLECGVDLGAALTELGALFRDGAGFRRLTGRGRRTKL